MYVVSKAFITPRLLLMSTLTAPGCQTAVKRRPVAVGDTLTMSVVHADDNSGIDGLPTGEIFEILNSERRRSVIEILAEKGEIDRHKLADLVASIENDTEVPELSDAERKRVQASLKQTHLVKLRDTHVIDWDKSTETISPGPFFDDCHWYLSHGPGQKSGGFGILDRFKA